jgi:hypothetical protein
VSRSGLDPVHFLAIEGAAFDHAIEPSARRIGLSSCSIAIAKA